MYDKISRVLVTGGTGMVGSNILEHPLASSFQIFAPSRSELDLSDFNKVKTYLSEINPDIIIHAAGKVGGIQANISDPVSFLVENVDIARNLILGAKEAGVTKIINLASSCMYPCKAENPLKEEFILEGRLEKTNEGYALAKILSLRLCQYINQGNQGYNYKTIIPCNIYGRFDKFDPKHSHMVPAIVHKLHVAKVNGDKTVDIWGDGTARREFMYAGDLADCIWHCVTNFDLVPEVMNAGLGHDWSVQEYYEIAAKAIGFNGCFQNDLSKPVGMKQKLVCIEKLISIGWSTPTSLLDGLQKTYEFYLKERKNDCL